MASEPKRLRKRLRKVLRKHHWDPTNEWCAGEGYRFPSPRFPSYEHHLADVLLAVTEGQEDRR